MIMAKTKFKQYRPKKAPISTSFDILYAELRLYSRVPGPESDVCL